MGLTNLDKNNFVQVRKTKQWHSVVLGEATRILLVWSTTNLLKSCQWINLTWGTIVDY